MSISQFAKDYHEKLFPGYDSSFDRTDPEFVEIFDNFAFDEVINEPRGALDDKTRFLSLLAVLLGCQGIDEFKAMLPATMNFGVTPVEIKETIYQAVAYLGIGRVLPFLNAANEIFTEKGIALPLEGQQTTNPETRLQAGARAQADIFGDHMLEFYKSGPHHSQQINFFLADNCFGDYYTRKGLDYAMRELITFCFLYAQGGCEPQLISHVKANVRVGNSKEKLIAVITANIPYIGYPRTLNALRCIEEGCKE